MLILNLPLDIVAKIWLSGILVLKILAIPHQKKSFENPINICYNNKCIYA